jgi:uncharacterized phage protein gp47/JayE
MPYPYEPPDFLQNQSADDIHRRMMASMPDDIDKSELQIPWDYTRPSALIKAEFAGFELNETIKLMFPHWAYGEWLDLHAGQEGITRRAANPASGILTVNGELNTTIAEGFQFATQANLTPSVIFETTEETTIGAGSYIIMDASEMPGAVIQLTLNSVSQRPLALTLQPTDDPEVGELLLLDDQMILERFTFCTTGGANQVNELLDTLTATPSSYFTLTKLGESSEPLAVIINGVIGTHVPIRAVEGGREGNVPPDTIILMVRQDSGITYITNPAATSGGTPEESDDELRERILDSIRRGISYTGCDADYVRWAKEVPGVGQAVTQAEWSGPGTVRLFIIDANGAPANQQILDAVYNHIISPDDRMQRLAPIGATLTVAAPAPLFIDVAAAVILRDGENLGTVTDRFEANLDAYWLEATTENDMTDVQSGAAQNYVKYVFVGATLAQTAGVANYSGLTVNSGTADILIPMGQFPVTRGVELSE